MAVPAGRLLSLNVGMPRDIEWEGRTVHTGIWKDSVEGRRRVGRLNVEGDGQGDLQGHGGVNRAVFVYQIESYRHWQEFLDRDDFSYGQFGENLTVAGLADDEVCIGDRYRIGSALFEVSQPRVTCYRVGLRMNEPQMPSLLVAHRRPGFYLRVLEEGEVGAGDAIECVERGPEAMTVAEIDGLLYLPNRTRRDLTRALRIPALSEGGRNPSATCSSRRRRAKRQGARNSAEHPFDAEARDLLAQLPDAHRIVCYSDPGPRDRHFDIAGRLTAAVLTDVGVPTDADFYLCGPGPFMDDIAAGLTARGVAPDRVSTEVFGPGKSQTPGVVGTTATAPHPPTGAPGPGPLISFGRSNLSVPWDPAFTSLLELAEACDVPVRWSCRTGVCHTCETGLVSGEVIYHPDPLEQPAPGSALICCSQPSSDLALDL